MKSFLGMIGYLAKFIPCYSVLTAPLRRLTSQDVPFSWGPEEDAAFKKLKDSITSDDTMAFFDPRKPIVVIQKLASMRDCLLGYFREQQRDYSQFTI